MYIVYSHRKVQQNLRRFLMWWINLMKMWIDSDLYGEANENYDEKSLKSCDRNVVYYLPTPLNQPFHLVRLQIVLIRSYAHAFIQFYSRLRHVITDWSADSRSDFVPSWLCDVTWYRCSTGTTTVPQVCCGPIVVPDLFRSETHVITYWSADSRSDFVPSWLCDVTWYRCSTGTTTVPQVCCGSIVVPGLFRSETHVITYWSADSRSDFVLSWLCDVRGTGAVPVPQLFHKFVVVQSRYRVEVLHFCPPLHYVHGGQKCST